jgi:hypothetical protein
VQGQCSIGSPADIPTEGHPAGATNNGHLVGFLRAAGKTKFGEIGVQHIQRLNLPQLRQEGYPVASGDDDLTDTTQFWRSRRSQQRQAPERVQSLHNSVVDLLLVCLVQFGGRAPIRIPRMLT